MSFQTIEGRTARRKVGQVDVEALGREATTFVVFAKKTDAEVLGVYALEGLRLKVDPANQELRRGRVMKAMSA